MSSSEIERLKREINELSSRKTTLESDINTKNREIASLNERIRELERSDSENRITKERELNAKKREFNDTNNEIEALKRDIANLESDIVRTKEDLGIEYETVEEEKAFVQNKKNNLEKVLNKYVDKYYGYKTFSDWETQITDRESMYNRSAGRRREGIYFRYDKLKEYIGNKFGNRINNTTTGQLMINKFFKGDQEITKNPVNFNSFILTRSFNIKNDIFFHRDNSKNKRNISVYNTDSKNDNEIRFNTSGYAYSGHMDLLLVRNSPTNLRKIDYTRLNNMISIRSGIKEHIAEQGVDNLLFFNTSRANSNIVKHTELEEGFNDSVIRYKGVSKNKIEFICKSPKLLTIIIKFKLRDECRFIYKGDNLLGKVFNESPEYDILRDDIPVTDYADIIEYRVGKDYLYNVFGTEEKKVRLTFLGENGILEIDDDLGAVYVEIYEFDMLEGPYEEAREFAIGEEE